MPHCEGRAGLLRTFANPVRARRGVARVARGVGIGPSELSNVAAAVPPSGTVAVAQ